MAVEFVAVDWSGAVTGEAARIWIARATDGVLTALDAPGSRAAVRDVLLDRRRTMSPCVVGLDFAFSVPAWFAEQRGWRDADAVWAAAEADGERWLTDCEPPFWGRPGKRRSHPANDGLRATERHGPATWRPKSVFQVGGAGSVGTGSIRGMPMLRTLRRAGYAIWPFDAAGTHTVVEIYPRAFTGAVVKSSGEARADHLAHHHPTVPEAFRAVMTRSEDAFDAGISAIVMSATPQSPEAWLRPDALEVIEGRIWMPGGHASA